MLSQLTNTFFPICSLTISVFLCCIFFLKKNIENKETKIYSSLIICGLLEAFLYTFICITGDFFFCDATYHFYTLLNKILCIIYILWMTLLYYYIFAISNNSSDTNKKIKKYLIFFDVVFAVLIFINRVDLELDIVTKFSNATGPVINILYIIVFLYLLLMIVTLLKNFKNKNLKGKFIPYYVLFFLFTLSFVIRIVDPYFNITSNIFSFVLLIMYHTIENPDVKMIEQLNIAKEQAERANNAKSDFLSSMSHEIRTPLNAIVGFSQALQEENLPEEAKDEVKDIVMASETLLDIVNGILDISKIEANKLEIVNTEYNFNEMLEELVSLTKARLGEKPLEFKCNFDPSIPNYLYGDRVRVKQVILNILTNAVKYTEEGWVEFKVNSVRMNDVCRLIISVEDTGRGIKKENIDKLFTKFQRLEEDKNTTIEGTGLGLAITKKLIELMGGQIVVQSIYGRGSKFTIAIDQKIVNNPTVMVETLTTDTVVNDKLDFSSKKILIVDDNKINLKVASRLLQDYSCIIETLESGFECIEKIKAGVTYDLILMDDMMPKMSGTETLHNLKALSNFNIPVVALTANAISGMREKYLSEGFNDYLSKPIDKNDLNCVLVKFLSQK